MKGIIMKILIVGDLHLRVRCPRKRTDENFMHTCLDKLHQILDIAVEFGCDFIVQAGDFFDSPDPSKELIAEVIEHLRTSSCPVFVIHGQHDLAFHNKNASRRSALRILEAARCLTSLNTIPEGYGNTNLYGASFGQTPTPPKNTDVYNILVAHTMVGNRPLWPGHDLTGPKAYMRKYPWFDLYVVGDYHYPFEETCKDKVMINAGAVLRLTSDKRDRTRHPKVVVYDTKTNEAEDIHLKVLPWETVFDLTEEETDKPQFDELIDRLRKQGEIGVSFAENLASYLEGRDVEEAVRDLLWECLETK